ncbi:hypothetical protein M2271_008440 [Streptomyces sp. LBL]|uniref:DUF7660 family protein n=1 Tax=Streptomyces sp. LBL TaxID=2940562 RepID=UPI00247517E0|nr:hypothetical protein [Streptomyces sp. LBL]MDH6630579.1 hypothetical protein [Streptomyces sp. LBL]
MNWPDAQLNEINSRDDLAAYLRDLAKTVSDGRIALENPLTEDFVDASARWTKAMDGFFKNVIEEPVPDSPSWAMIAAIFRAAVTYE